MEKPLPISCRYRTTHLPAVTWSVVIALVLMSASTLSVLGQQAGPDAATPIDVKRGVLIDVPLPITSRVVKSVTQALEAVTVSGSGANQSARTTVVLRYRSDQSDGSVTQFEDALRLARAVARPEFRRLRIAAFVEGKIRGHVALPVMASDSLVVTQDVVIQDAAVNEERGSADATVVAAYQTVAARRGLFPPEVVRALVQPGPELVLATTLDGKRRFVSGDELTNLRREGGGWREDVWAASDQPLVLTADRLRSARIASHLVDSLDQVPAALDLAELAPVGDPLIQDGQTAGLLEITGAISADRVRRWELNLAKATDAGELNTAVVAIDSAGGQLDSSLRLAGTLSSTHPPLQRVIGYIQSSSRGDAALIALACKPLYLHPDATLGGPGGQAIDASDLEPIDEAISQIATDTGRPASLIRGLLNPQLKVFRYTHTKTGQVRYASEDELALGSDEPEAERRMWRRGELISLAEGLKATQAIELGLAEGLAASLEELAATAGMAEVPALITDRGLVHFVEWIGGMKGVSIFLLMVGMVALSMEAGAPGLSVPGFVSLLCFSAYFWIQFLNGTAQWLEILAFALGVVCIVIELFLLPGVGVFGIGGLCLLVLGVVLTSQTFVIPRNTYQFEQLTRNLWLVVGGFGSIVVGLTLLRLMMPQHLILRHLALETPDDEVIERAERLADYEYLQGESGVTTTALRPAGKARFGNDIVQVISDGTPLGAGEAVRVIDVKGNRVVVAPLE